MVATRRKPLTMAQAQKRLIWLIPAIGATVIPVWAFLGLAFVGRLSLEPFLRLCLLDIVPYLGGCGVGTLLATYPKRRVLVTITLVIALILVMVVASGALPWDWALRGMPEKAAHRIADSFMVVWIVGMVATSMKEGRDGFLRAMVAAGRIEPADPASPAGS